MKYITNKDLEKARKKAFSEEDKIPYRFNRKRFECYHENLKSEILKMDSRTHGKIDGIVYIQNENEGTKKWPWIVEEVLVCSVKNDAIRETEKSYIIEGSSRGWHRHTVISKLKVIAFIKK